MADDQQDKPSGAPEGEGFAAKSYALSTDRTEWSSQSTQWSLLRTTVAIDRTLLAWIRTSLSMISFGFTLYKFFEYLAQAQGGVRIGRHDAPRNLGLSLIALGVVALIAALFQHHKLLVTIAPEQYRPKLPLASIVGMLVALLGTLVFISIVYRVGPF